MSCWTLTSFFLGEEPVPWTKLKRDFVVSVMCVFTPLLTIKGPIDSVVLGTDLFDSYIF